MARKRRRGRKRRHHAVTRSRHTRSNPIARRRGRKSSRRGFRRNPGGSGIVARLIDAAKGGALVTVGKVVSRAIPTLVGVTPVGPLGLLVQAAAGTGACLLGERLIGRENARIALYGVTSGIMESLLRGANLPIVSGALGDETELYALAGYTQPAGINGYAGQPAGMGMGDDLLVMGNG